jgi:regulator of sigma E protease
VFNLLPIPFLDGGRFVFIALEAVRHRRVDPRREAAIHYVGLMLILALVVYVTFTGDIGSRS